MSTLSSTPFGFQTTAAEVAADIVRGTGTQRPAVAAIELAARIVAVSPSASQVVHERGGLGASGVAAYALDADNAERLWARSLELIGRS